MENVSSPTDPSFTEAFMITFKTFTSTPELIDLLVARFEKEPPEGLNDPEELTDWKRNWQDPVRGRVVNSMRRLLVEDDGISADDTVALAKLSAFTARHESTYTGAKMVAGTLQTLVGSFFMFSPQITSLPSLQISTGSAPSRKLSKAIPIGAPQPAVPKVGPNKKLKIMDMDPLEIARQLTLMESELFTKIKGTECLARAKDGQTDNDNIKAIILMSNKARITTNKSAQDLLT